MKSRTVVGLAALGLLLGVVVVAALMRSPREGEEDVVVIEVTASRYAYDPGSESPINVSRGSVVILRITSLDVAHGFAIVEYGVNVEAAPGETVEVRFVADEPGDFTIFCTVFCGSGHPRHKGVLHVE